MKIKQSIKSTSSCSRTLKSFHTQIIFGTSFTYLTSGVFLSALATYMGASDLLKSYISMITNICGISILFFSSITDRFHSYKKITVTLTIFSRLATLMIVLIPLFIPDKAQIAAFIPLMVVAFTLQAQTTVVLNNWMVTFVDEKQSGQYIAKRQTIVLLVTVILALTGGKLLDGFPGQYIGFAILFSIAFLMSIFEIITLLGIHDSLQQKNTEKKKGFHEMWFVPIKCKPFFRFIVYIFMFYMLLTIADSFTVVYMMSYLELPYTTITAMQMLISLPQIFLLGFWGKISDKKGHKFALIASIWFFVGETLFLALSNTHNLYVFIPIAFLFASVGNSGFLLSVFNRRFELMPKEGRILYDNFYSAAIGLAFILGPVIGGGIKKLLESNSWVKSTIQFGNIRLLYVVSTIGIILLQLIICYSNRPKKSSI